MVRAPGIDLGGLGFNSLSGHITFNINRPLATLYCVMYANVVLMTCLFQAAVVFQVAVNDCTPTCGRDGGLVISQ